MNDKKYFRVKSPTPMDVGGVWHKLMRCQEHTGIAVNLDPTVESKAKGAGHHLEWDVPDTEYNRAHLARFLPAFKEIEVKVVQKIESKKKSFFSKKKEEPKKLNPEQVKELKSKIKEKLDADGIKYSKTASLKELQDLIPKATPKK